MCKKGKVVVFANQKGGCGKTTMANEFAAGLCEMGFKVLAVDMDPQGNLSDSARVNTADAGLTTMYDVLKGTVHIADAVCHTDKYDIIPSNILLASAEQEISTRIGRERILKKALDEVAEDYDYIVIDTPPSLGTLTVNAFTAADRAVIPILPDLFAVSGVTKLNDIIELIRENCNSNLVISGIVLTQFDMRTNNSQTIRAITDAISEKLHVPVFTTTIRKAVAVADARTAHQTVKEYGDAKARKVTVASDFEQFVEEFLQKEGAA